MEDLGSRIKFTRMRKNISQRKLAQELGISPARLSNWERGLSRPNTEFIEKIAQILGVDYYDLVDMDFEAETVFDFMELHGREFHGELANTPEYQDYQVDMALVKRVRALDPSGRRFIYQVLEHEEQRLAQLEKLKNEPRISHPVYLLAASAGSGQFLDSDQYDLVDFPEDAVPRESNFGVRVTGDSMVPDYPDGSIVFVKRAKELNPGDIGVFTLNEESYVKQLGEHNNLVSLNSAYDDIHIRDCDDCKIVGKVVGVYDGKGEK